MKKWIGLISLLVFFNACIPCFHPIYTKDTLVDYQPLEGKWLENEKDVNSWTFEAAEKGNYKLTCIQEGKKGTFDLHLVRLNDQHFFDFYPREPDFFGDQLHPFYEVMLPPMHMFAKVDFEDDQIRLYFMDPVWIDKLLENDPAAIRYEKTEDKLLLTASTGELQQFLIKYQNDEEAFPDEIVLKRS